MAGLGFELTIPGLTSDYKSDMQRTVLPGPALTFYGFNHSKQILGDNRGLNQLKASRFGERNKFNCSNGFLVVSNNTRFQHAPSV